MRPSLSWRPAARAAGRAAIIGSLAAALALTVAGCSAVKLGYNQGGTLVYRWLDGYVDFNDAQAVRVRAALDETFAWHRRTQLNDYADLLARMERELPSDATPQRLCGLAGDVRTRFETLFEHVLPALAEVAPTLTPKQIANIEKRMADKDEDFRDEFLQANPARRRKAAIEREIERGESFYGRLDDAQRELIARSAAASPYDAEVSYAERLQRQQEALALLRRLRSTAPGNAEAQAQIRATLQRLDRSPRDAYRQYSERLVEFNCTFASTLHNTMSPVQRQAAVKKLKGYETALRELAADSPA